MLSIGGLKKVNKPSLKTAFNDNNEADDEEMDVLAKKANAQKPLPMSRVNAAPISRVAREQLKAAQEMDPSVFEYDGVFDDMKAGQKKAEEARKAQAQDRQPQYVESLLASAVQRKQDRIRAEDVMTARARAKEGDEFADKESFVTPAYVQQQEELRAAEEAEKLKNGTVKKGGMAAFYQTYLANSSADHEAAMKAAQESATKPKSAQPQQAYDEEPVSDVHLAREAIGRTGKMVELNEDGQIIDRTQLLTGGLNVLKKPKKKVQGPLAGSIDKPEDLEGFAVPISQRTSHTKQEQSISAAAAEEPHYSGLSEAQRRKLQRERQSALLERQMIELAEKKRKAEEEENEREIKKVARRNDESKVEELKRLAMERRQARLAANSTASGTA